MAGGCCFFTVNPLQRRGNDLLVRRIDLLREALRMVKRRHPFRIEGRVALPDPMHRIWTPPNLD